MTEYENNKGKNHSRNPSLTNQCNSVTLSGKKIIYEGCCEIVIENLVHWKKKGKQQPI